MRLGSTDSALNQKGAVNFFKPNWIGKIRSLERVAYKTAAGLLVLTVLFYFLSFSEYSYASQGESDDDRITVLATKPYVTLQGTPQELYDVRDPLTIATNLTSNDPQRQLEVVPIIEIRDSSDITVLLYSEAGTIPAGGELNISFSWVPEKRDAYLIRVYVISDLVNPRLLTVPLYTKTVAIEPDAKSIVDFINVGNQTNGLPRIISKTNISNSSDHSLVYSLSASGDVVCVVWREHPYGLDYMPSDAPRLYRISHDRGATFGETAELDSSNDTGNCEDSGWLGKLGNRADVHIELNQTHGLSYYAEGGNQDLVTLTAMIHNNTGNFQASWSSRLAYSEMVKDMLVRASGRNVNLFWSDIPYGHTERQLYFASSSDFGEHVTMTKLRSSLNGNQIWPNHLHLLAASNTVLLLWSDMVGTETDNQWKILSERSTDGGATLSGLVDLTPNTDSAFDPLLAYSNGNLYLIWQEYEAGQPGEIFFAKSTDYGLTFGEG